MFQSLLQIRLNFLEKNCLKVLFSEIESFEFLKKNLIFVFVFECFEEKNYLP